MKRNLLALSVSLLILCGFYVPSRADTTLIGDQFDYTLNSTLPSPWTVTYNGDGTPNGTVTTVTTSATYNGFTPQGNAVWMSRSSGGNAPTMKVISGDIPGTTLMSVSAGLHLTLTLDFSYTALPNNTAVQFSLMSNVVYLASIRLINTTAKGTTLQYMTTNSSSSFTDVPGDLPALSASTWYRLTMDLTFTTNKQTVYDLNIAELGDNAQTIYSLTGLTEDSASTFSSTAPINLSVLTTGNNTYSYADVELTAIPEPSSAVLMGLSGLLLLAFGQRLQCRD